MAPARYSARGLGGPSLPASTRVLLGARAVGGPRGTDCPASGRASFLQGLRKSSLDLRKSSRGWNTAASMTPMFKKAGVFDRDISSWNTSTLTTCPSCSRTPAPSTRTSPVGLERDGRNKQREHVGWSDCHDGGTQASRGSRAKRPEEAGPSVQRKPGQASRGSPGGHGHRCWSRRHYALAEMRWRLVNTAILHPIMRIMPRRAAGQADAPARSRSPLTFFVYS